MEFFDFDDCAASAWVVADFHHRDAEFGGVPGFGDSYKWECVSFLSGGDGQSSPGAVCGDAVEFADAEIFGLPLIGFCLARARFGVGTHGCDFGLGWSYDLRSVHDGCDLWIGVRH